MTRRSRFFTIFAAGAVAAAALAGPGATDARGQSSMFDPDAAVRVFHENVESYAVLHRRLAPPPAAATSTDPLSRLLTARYLASAVQSSRPNAQQGDIFTPHAAAVFRRLLAASIGERDGATFLAELGAGELVPQGMHPTVNEPYSMTTVYRLPAEVRLGLPSLPAELDYRIAAHDLLLWDIYAGIVVDFVPNAFASPVFTEE
jgi:hypothetical protein